MRRWLQLQDDFINLDNVVKFSFEKGELRVMYVNGIHTRYQVTEGVKEMIVECLGSDSTPMVNVEGEQ